MMKDGIREKHSYERKSARREKSLCECRSGRGAWEEGCVWGKGCVGEGVWEEQCVGGEVCRRNEGIHVKRGEAGDNVAARN